MRRMRRSRRTSYSHESSKDTMPSPTLSTDKKEIKAVNFDKESVKQVSASVQKPTASDNVRQQKKEAENAPKTQMSNPSGIVAKAKERFGKDDENHAIFSKDRQQEINTPVAKKIATVERISDAGSRTADTVTHKLANKVIVITLP